MEDAGAGLLVLALADPHDVKTAETAQNAPSDPGGVFPLVGGDYLKNTLKWR
jgi:hypothetical protein